MSIVTRSYSILDDKTCFDAWLEHGTLKKAAEELYRRGIISPMTKKPYTIASIANHAMRWVIEHPDEARPIYIREGSRLTDEQWEMWLVEKAMSVHKYSPTGFFNWVELNDFEQYEYLYEKKFGNMHDWRTSPRVRGKSRI